MKNKKNALKGIIPPIVTPLIDRDTIDLKGLERLIEHMLKAGVHGIFVLGSTGEAPSLSYKVRSQMIRNTCRIVDGRVPVLTGITDTAFTESLNICKIAADSGSLAAVLAPPYYFPAGQDELMEYLEHIVPELPLPVYLYNMPGYTKLYFEPMTVKRAYEDLGIKGLKDSSGNMIYFHKIKSVFTEAKDFSLFIGPEELLAESLMFGADGGVCGGANFYPSLYVELYNACQSRDMAKIQELHAKVMAVHSTIYSVGKFGSSFLKGVKCSLSCMGICNDFLAEPFHAFKKKERDRIKTHLKGLGLL